jgi:NADPH-dependent curcumin reductase CurA
LGSSVVAGVVGLARVPEALASLTSGRTTGKVVVVPT